MALIIMVALIALVLIANVIVDRLQQRRRGQPHTSDNWVARALDRLDWDYTPPHYPGSDGWSGSHESSSDNSLDFPTFCDFGSHDCGSHDGGGHGGDCGGGDCGGSH